MGVISSDFVEQGERGGRRQRIGENTLMLCLDIKIQLPRSLLIILLVRQKKKKHREVIFIRLLVWDKPKKKSVMSLCKN